MTNDEARMTNECPMTNAQPTSFPSSGLGTQATKLCFAPSGKQSFRAWVLGNQGTVRFGYWGLVIDPSFGLRHSSFLHFWGNNPC
jgi:hypothetical protein